MARYGCTITVDTGKIPSSQSNFAWLVTEGNFPTAAVDGGGTSILNGGGNLRCYTDDTKATQLPIEVVSFVTGGTPSVQVWGLSPTLAVASTVYIEADTVATTQPAVTGTYGRNAVWVDYLWVTTNGGSLDSTGNSVMSVTGTPAAITDQAGNGALDYVGTEYYLSDSVYAVTSPATVTIGAWFNPTTFDSYGTTISLCDSTVTNQQLKVGDNSSEATAFSWNGTQQFNNYAGALSAGTWYFEVAKFDAATSESIIKVNDGAPKASLYRIPTTTLDRVGIAVSSDSTPYSSGNKGIGFGFIAESIIGEDKLDGMYSNQIGPSTFWITSAWTDQDAGGITATVSETGPSFTESINTNLSVNITGNITESGPSFTESITATLSTLTIQSNIAESGPSFSESISATLAESLVINASITEQGPSFTENINANLDVNLSATITELGPSFTESINVNLTTEISANITEFGPNFSENVLVKTPVQWVDKVKANTDWSDKAKVSTIWINIV